MKIYKVEKIEIATEKVSNCGTMCEEDMKLCVKGYTFNGLFYERKNGKYIFIVTEINH